jgi:hypothetical protein
MIVRKERNDAPRISLGLDQSVKLTSLAIKTRVASEWFKNFPRRSADQGTYLTFDGAVLLAVVAALSRKH